MFYIGLFQLCIIELFFEFERIIIDSKLKFKFNEKDLRKTLFFDYKNWQ